MIFMIEKPASQRNKNNLKKRMILNPDILRRGNFNNYDNGKKRTN